MIDFHAHILPGADHGSANIAESLAQLKKAESIGITTIVATSHYYIQDNEIDEFLERRDKAYNELMKEYKGKIRIIKGAEVTMAFDIAELDDLEKLCIDGTNCILLEMPTTAGGPWIYSAIDKIKARGLEPIIAHVDRYAPDVQENLLEKDILIQVNAVAFVNFSTRRRMTENLKMGRVHLIGSDVHDKEATQYDRFYKAMKRLQGYGKFLQDNASNILGVPIDG